MSDIKQPEPEYIANAPPEYEKIPHKEAQTVCFADLSKEERMMFADKLCCKKFKKHVEDFEACGGYDRAKRDWCKEMREEKEAEQSRLAEEASLREKAKAERLAVLEAREAVWVEYSKEQEKVFSDYKAKTEERLNKLAMLVQQLAGK